MKQSELDKAAGRLLVFQSNLKTKTAKSNLKTKTAKAISGTGFLMTMFKTVFLPSLPAIVGELLTGKDGKKRYARYLIPLRDTLIGAQLDD